MNIDSSNSLTRSSFVSRELSRRVRAELARRHPENLFHWALANREFNGQPMRLPPMLQSLYEDSHKFIVVQKSAQVGVSEYLTSAAIWVADTGQGGRGNALYVMPTLSQAEDFASARINKALWESPTLSERVRPRPGAVKSATRTLTRRINKGHLYVRGAESSNQLITVDADMLILDEFDAMPDGTLELARRRLSSSCLGWIRIASTPTVPGIGTNALFLRGDQRYWWITCLRCPTEQVLTWPDNVDVERAMIICANCREALDNQSAGRWIPDRPEVKDVRSYQVSYLYSPYLDLPRLIAASKATDPMGVRQFFNSDLGEPYAGEGDRLSVAILDSCRRQYSSVSRPLGTCMGVDVGNKLHFVVRTPDPDHEEASLLLEAGIVSFEDLDRLMATYQVQICVVDAQPENHAARAFAARWPGKVWLCRYQQRTTGAAWNAETMEVTVDRTASLDALFQAFRRERLLLPQHARSLGGDVRDNLGSYYRNLCSLTRSLLQDGSGTTVYRYVASGPDHFAHGENYCLLALSRLPRSSGELPIALERPSPWRGIGMDPDSPRGRRNWGYQ